MRPDTSDYRFEERIVRIPVDAHRSKSHKGSGAASDLLRQNGTNKLLGPTESYSIEEARRLGIPTSRPDAPRGSGREGLTPAQQLAAQVLGEVLEAVVVQVVAPAVGRQVRKLAYRTREAIRRDEHQSRSVEAAMEPSRADTTTPNLHPSVKTDQVMMSAEEFAHRLREALFADAYAAWQRDQLSNAQIEDGTAPPELQRTLEKLLIDGASAINQSEWDALVQFLECARPPDCPALPTPGVDDVEALPLLPRPACGSKSNETRE